MESVVRGEEWRACCGWRGMKWIEDYIPSNLNA